jgi:DNA polymerase-3 subunit gamma/tau
VVGQEHITTTLQNSIRTGRIHHAYLFSGPRGVGKTTTARIYARALNCYEPIDIEPCNKCASCEAILTSRSMDVIEIDGASNNSVDDIRKLRENSKYPPVAGKYKMYIIDEVHMLSTSAFNALLKTLEEPPPHLIFVFATTESHKVPATILSRCQRFDFRRMDIQSIAKQLSFIAGKENIEIDEDALVGIAKKADGSMRDGQSIFDQVLAFCGKKIKYSDMANALHLIDQEFFFRITGTIRDKNLNEMFNIAREVVSKGYDLQECLGGLLEHVRNLLTIKVAGNSDFIESSSSFTEKYKQEAVAFTKTDLIRFMNLIASTEQALKFAPQPRVRFELALVQLADMDSSVNITELIEEIRDLKKNGLTNSGSVEPYRPKPIAEKQSYQEKEATSSYKPAVQEEPSEEDDGTSDYVTSGYSDITKESIAGGWQTFLRQYADGKHGLYMLGQTEMVKPIFFNGEIVLRTDSEFTSDNINKKKKIIKDYLKVFYGGDVDIKILKDSDPNYTPENGLEADYSSEDIKDSDEYDPEPTQGDKRIEEIVAEEAELAKKSKEVTVVVTTEDLTPVEETIVQLFSAVEVSG